VKAFADTVITPLVNAAGGGGTNGLGFTVNGQLVDIGALVSAIIYFVIFVAVVYFAIVVPYRQYARRRGIAAFSEPPPSKACPACLSDGLRSRPRSAATAGRPSPWMRAAARPSRRS